MTDATSHDETDRAQLAKELFEALDAFENHHVNLGVLRRRAAAYKRRLSGGARRAHEACIRDMNANRGSWLSTMRANTQYLEACYKRDAEVRLAKLAPKGRDLALLGCSKAKRASKGPARDVYDGPAFRMLRKEPVDLFIVSAKYGLIEGETWIAPYDQRLSARPDEAFVARLRADLGERVAVRRYERVVVLLGADYSRAVGPLSAFAWHGAHVVVTQGRIGARLHALRAWLDASPRGAPS